MINKWSTYNLATSTPAAGRTQRVYSLPFSDTKAVESSVSVDFNYEDMSVLNCFDMSPG